jgi:hypothetical protein
VAGERVEAAGTCSPSAETAIRTPSRLPTLNCCRTNVTVDAASDAGPYAGGFKPQPSPPSGWRGADVNDGRGGVVGVLCERLVLRRGACDRRGCCSSHVIVGTALRFSIRGPPGAVAARGRCLLEWRGALRSPKHVVTSAWG